VTDVEADVSPAPTAQEGPPKPDLDDVAAASPGLEVGIRGRGRMTCIVLLPAGLGQMSSMSGLCRRAWLAECGGGQRAKEDRTGRGGPLQTVGLQKTKCWPSPDSGLRNYFSQ
jgi:hypothetical protein